VAQNLANQITQINDLNGNIAQIDPVSGLAVNSPSVNEILEEQLETMQDIENYLEALSQTGMGSSAASLPVTIANDQVVATSMPDVVVSGRITVTAPSYIGSGVSQSFIKGSYVDISLNGHSIVAAGIDSYGVASTGYIYAAYSLDGIYYSVVPKLVILSNSYAMPSGNAQGTSASAPDIFLIPCSGYKIVRLIAWTGTGGASITLRASTAFPMNYLSVLTSLYTNNSVTIVQSITNAATLIPRFYPALQRCLITAAANSSMSIIANNPNDILIYLLFYNIASYSGMFSGTVLYTIALPPGPYVVPAGNFSLGSFTTGLCIAASTSPYSYAPPALGPDVTIFAGS